MRFRSLPSPRRVGYVVLARVLLAPGLLAAQSSPHAPGAPILSASDTTAAGAPPPTHAASGRLEVRAVPVRGRVVIDGALDDEVWRYAVPVSGFVQSEPHGGAPATEQTEVRVAFDSDNLYVGAVMHDRDPDRLVVNDIRKDFREDDQDTFEVLLDTFGDQRNGYIFGTNPQGAKADRQVANEGRETNASWDAVWTVRTRRTADGWTAEFAIPFRALRFDRGSGRAWGINFARRVRRKNEIDYWSPVPRAFNLTRVSLAGELAGLETGSAGRDLRVKPYVVASTLRPPGAIDATTGVPTQPGFTSRADAGVDVKYGISSGLTLDVTVRPDFAQVEADEQQLNLTQFSQFFPEKRDFFLENSGVFYVGDAARNNRVALAPTPDEDLLLFFSRRIGLTTDGRPIPIDGGVRLTGSVGGTRVGALSMETRPFGNLPRTNYSVVRARRNLLSTSDVGALVMQRVGGAGDYNRVAGVDGNIRLFGSWDWNAYAVTSRTPGKRGGQYAWRSSLMHEGNFFHVKAGVLSIGDGFQDDLAYLRRVGVRKYIADMGIRPRFAALQAHGIREMHPHLVWDYYTDLAGRTIAKKLHTGYTFFFNNGAFAEWSENPNYQLITRGFRINRAIAPIPPGGYEWLEHALKFNTDLSRPLALSGGVTLGGLWSGTQRTVNGTMTYRPSYKLRLAVGGQRTAATLRQPDAGFVATLLTGRASYSFSTAMFIDALSQFDPQTRQFNANVRFNLIHHPLSDLFIVYNDQRVLTPEAPIAGRSLIVKVTQMMAF